MQPGGRSQNTCHTCWCAWATWTPVQCSLKDGARTLVTPAGVPGQLGHLSNVAWRTEPKPLATPAGVPGQRGHLSNAAWRAEPMVQGAFPAPGRAIDPTSTTTPAPPAGAPGNSGHLSNAAWRAGPMVQGAFPGPGRAVDPLSTTTPAPLLEHLETMDTCPMQPGGRGRWCRVHSQDLGELLIHYQLRHLPHLLEHLGHLDSRPGSRGNRDTCDTRCTCWCICDACHTYCQLKLWDWFKVRVIARRTNRTTWWITK